MLMLSRAMVTGQGSATRRRLPILVCDCASIGIGRHWPPFIFPSCVGYYGVLLATPNVLAELTAAGVYTGVHRYTFQGLGNNYVILDPTHSVLKLQRQKHREEGTCWGLRNMLGTREHAGD